MPAISDVTDLQNMNNDLAGTYWLANDIDAAITSTWNGGAGFIPIGQGAPYFTGSLDSKGYVISDLFINRPATDYIGLFGVITTGAVLKDVVLTDVDITGDDFVGGLVGYDFGTSTTISGCHTTGSVEGIDDNVGGLIGGEGSTGLSISDSYSTATITAGVGGGFIGGFIGWLAANGVIAGCYATGNITAGGFRLGGFAGQIWDAGSTLAISKCYAAGNVESTSPFNEVGGFAGYVRETGTTTINDCYARGSAIGDERIGGFVGYLLGGTIEDCYSTGAPSGSADVGGFCGLNGDTITDCFWDTETAGTAVSDGGTGKTTSQMQRKSTFTDTGWDFIIIWAINGITNAGYPFFWAMPPEPPPDAPRRTVAVQDKITLESIRNVEMAAGGRFYINEEGKAVYKSRYARNL